MSDQSREDIEPLPIYTNIAPSALASNNEQVPVNVVVKKENEKEAHAYTFSKFNMKAAPSKRNESSDNIKSS